MSITSLSDLSDDVVDFTIEEGGSGSGVPTGRTLTTTAPLTIDGGTSADLSSNRTLAITLSPAGTVAVSTARTLQGTAPIQIAGDNAAHDLSANRVISVVPFTGSVDGVVTHNASGVQGKYLKDDNTWGTSTAGGVTSVIAGNAISLSPSSGLGDVTVAAINVGNSSAGVVPATGGSFPTKFLCATSPVSWAVPGTGSFVTLQGSSPGSADSGNSHITGSLIADTKVIAENGQVNTSDLPNGGGVFGGGAALTYSAADGNGAALIIRKSRGTPASPAATVGGDALGSVQFQGRGTGWSGIVGGLFAYADGSPSSGNQGQYIDLIAGSSSGTVVQHRMSSTGLRLGAVVGIGGSSPFSSSQRALHSLDLLGSLGLQYNSVTGDYVMTAKDCVLGVDLTSNTPIEIDLPSAVGIPGRVYSFTRIDNTSGNRFFDVTPAGGQTMGGASQLRVLRQGDSLTIISDGANWQIIAYNIVDAWTNAADGTPVASTAAETTAMTIYPPYIKVGGIYKLRIAGKFSTTGTPTLRFKIKNGGGDIMADSGAITMPSSVTAAAFQIDASFVQRDDPLPTTVRTARAILSVAQAAGFGASMNSYNMMDTAMTTLASGSAITLLTAQWGTSSLSNTVTALEGALTIEPTSLVV